MPNHDLASTASPTGPLIPPIGTISTEFEKRTVTFVFGSRAPMLQTVEVFGTGNSNDMAAIDKLDDRLRVVEGDLATIRERIKHMPTTLVMWAAVLTAAAAIIGAIWAIIQFAGPGIIRAAVSAAQ